MAAVAGVDGTVADVASGVPPEGYELTVDALSGFLVDDAAVVADCKVQGLVKMENLVC